MATFKSGGVSSLQFDMQQIEELPDEVIEEMLRKTGEIAEAAMRASIRKLGIVDTEQLLESITVTEPRRRKNGTYYVLVYPSGNRRDVYVNFKLRKARIKGRVKKGRRKGQLIKMTNNDVGFVLEFGAPRQHIRAYQWMRRANEASAADVERAQLAIYDEFLKSNNF